MRERAQRRTDADSDADSDAGAYECDVTTLSGRSNELIEEGISAAAEDPIIT